MTTLLGVKSTSNIESIVIAADRQLTIEDGDKFSKRPIKKLYTGESWIMGDAGADDSEVDDFYTDMRKDESRTLQKIKTALEKGRFMEIDELNAKIMAKEEKCIDDAHCFILAINKPYLGLWKIDELGNLKTPPKELLIPYVCLGSGEEKVKERMEYILGEDEIDRENISTRQTINIGESCFTAAATRDLHTGLGLDMYVISKLGIRETSRKIRRAMLDAKKKEFEEECVYFDNLEREEAERRKGTISK